MIKKLISKLRLGRKIKRKKPDYLRPYWWRKIAFRNDPDHWRRPKGKHNKIKLRIKGKPARVETGYGSPKEVKGLLPNGKNPVLVRCIDDLNQINPERDAIILSSTLGKKKRLEIIKIAYEKGIEVWNLREDEKKFLEELENKQKENVEQAPAGI